MPNEKHMNVAVVDWSPFVKVTEDKLGNIGILGPMADVFNYLAKTLNFRYTFKVPSDRRWGAMMANGSYSGMVGMLQRNVRYPSGMVGMLQRNVRYPSGMVGMLQRNVRYPSGMVGMLQRNVRYPSGMVGMLQRNVRYPSGMVGMLQRNVRYPSGMIGMLQRNVRYQSGMEADLAVGPFTTSDDRLKVVYFSNTIYVDSYGVLAGSPTTNIDSFKYLLAIEWKVWCVVTVAMFGLSVLLTLAVLILNNEKIKPRIFSDHFFQYLWKFFQSLWNQVIMASFGGHLHSSLVVKNKGDHIDSLEDILRFPDVKIFIEGGSATETLFRKSEDKVLKKIWERIISVPDSRPQWDELISDKTIDEVQSNRATVVTTYVGIIGVLSRRYAEAKPCNLHLASKAFHSKYMAIALNKNLPNVLIDGINYRLSLLTESSIFQRNMAAVTKNATKCLAQGVAVSSLYNPQNITDLRGVFMLWLGGLGISNIVFLVEVTLLKKLSNKPV
ncbi:glutamate receptor 3-like [Tachypleus tridentatus]|uniref:glutamate receptor 3-like n=1 Tax=Tachypleus tridentatus TaxID=6853 RepID=UPI003FD33442